MQREKMNKCMTCKHYNSNGLNAFCVAFPDESYPDGIPEEILSDEVEHDKPFAGQVGETIYEEKTDEDE